MPKVNLRYIQLTPADAGEALDTIARLEGQGRGVIAAHLWRTTPTSRRDGGTLETSST